MSEFHVEVVQLGKIGKHPNADTLSITTINNGYPVIFRTGDFNEGDLAVYIPVDSLVPTQYPWFSFLKREGRNVERIRAKKLRGIFSMGLLIPKAQEWTLGQNVQEVLGIEKYEPPLSVSFGGENEKDPGFIPCYTDIEGLRKYSHLLTIGEEVIISEKIHGTSARFVWHEDRLWVGSHHQIKKEDASNLWWRVVEQNHLKEKLAKVPHIIFYGEVYGQVQNLKYETAPGELRVAFFDAMSIEKGRYLDHDDFLLLSRANSIDLPVVPQLFRGPWSDNLRELAEGKSTIAKHIREGFVVKPIHERFSPEIGRVILKLVGEGYLLQKG